ncbi:MAG: NYN domain-containing protein [Candidatus Saccharibacteria bacterium]|nr:NYN domain-containing protein [Candidatus Saccharibacteria bacterium]MCY4010840.1 NYN domain-containing protein [Candidatus Saccharibacteria bacterium]MCY4088576.1 NYN domain-containing protein [Candidatus Saccharibacteria bacterium]
MKRSVKSAHHTYVFIDSANLWEMQKYKRRLIDYEKLVKYIFRRFPSKKIKFFYYEAYPEEGTRSYNLGDRHKFYTFLEKGLKFKVIKKPLKRINVRVGSKHFVQEKGNMDVEMTIDAVHHRHQYQQVVLLTGDSDFLSLVQYLRTRNKKVYILASQASVSEELRTGADGYLNIIAIKSIWGDSLKHRADK